MKLFLIFQLFSTLSMVGLIWFVQVVHYPLFANVGREEFSLYEQRHQRLTTYVVAPLMLIELISACGLFWCYPNAHTNTLLWIGLSLLCLIWISTWSLQVPAHQALASAFSPAAHARLVATNWIRTVAWTARGILVLTLTFQSF